MSCASRRPLASRALYAVALPILLLGGIVLGTAPANAQKIGPAFFGMHDSAISVGSVPGVPTGAIRLWDDGTSWRDIESRNGVFDFSRLDTAVQTARAAGLRPLVVLGQTPQFHATVPDAAGAYGPGASSMPTVSSWKRYVGAVAARYGTTVDYQIWNEPNVIGYWTGTVAQMATLTATGGQAIHAKAGRKATVVAPSFPLRLSSQQKWFRAFWHAKVGGTSVANFVNVVAANLYPLDYQAPEDSMKLLSFVRSVLPKAARGKPFWNTEINYGLRGGPAAKRIPAAKQAAYVERTLVLNAANSVGRVFWYSWYVGPIANTQLVENDYTTLTRAGKAWSVARSWLLGTNVSGCHRASKGKLKGLYTCTAHKSTHEVRRIYWKPTGRAATVTTGKTTSKWATMDGRTRAHHGSVTLKVGQYPVMVTSRR